MNNELRDKVIEIVTDVYERQAQICDSADEIIELVEAALTQQQEAEPVVYQGRMRPGWDELGIWTQWENCSKGTFEDYKRVPVNAGWIYEARALYLHPPKEPTAQQQVPEGYALTPIEPADGLLISMACRDRHDFGLLSRGMQESIMGSMRQVHQEVVGAGFYNPDKEAEYKSMLSAAKEEGNKAESEYAEHIRRSSPKDNNHE